VILENRRRDGGGSFAKILLHADAVLVLCSRSLPLRKKMLAAPKYHHTCFRSRTKKTKIRASRTARRTGTINHALGWKIK
jgi:hypothetical protein